MFSASLITDLIDALAPLYNEWGYLIVFLGVLGENTALLGLVLPGGTLALLGAFYARQGTLALPLVVLFAWLGTAIRLLDRLSAGAVRAGSSGAGGDDEPAGAAIAVGRATAPGATPARPPWR